MKPLMVSPGATVATDDQLVKAAREGSDVAFEALVRRYRERITAYVRSVVHDSSRTEDITQETFISALRSLRATEQEIAFRPWVFQIARNACIDHLRKVRRTEEISINSEDFLSDHEVRISGPQSTDAAVIQRQDMDDLQQAFGGLPESQHEILLLREFEGLSYQEIGRRMNLTAPAVESMLARARRSLKGQYDEIATGERCLRMRPVITAVATGLAGKRDRRTLERHLRYCRYCRQDAIAGGLEELVVGAQQSRRSRAFSRAAAFLPLPWLLRRRGSSAAESLSSGGASSGAQIHISHLGALGPATIEQGASALQKAVAIVAVATVASGGGYAANKAGVPMPRVSGKEVTVGEKGSPKAPATQPASSVRSDGTSIKAIEQEGAAASPPGAALLPNTPQALSPFTAPPPGTPASGGGEETNGGAETDAQAALPGADVPATGGEADPTDGGQSVDDVIPDPLPLDPPLPIDEVVPPDVTVPLPDPPSGGGSGGGAGGETSNSGPTLGDSGVPTLPLLPLRHELSS